VENGHYAGDGAVRSQFDDSGVINRTTAKAFIRVTTSATTTAGQRDGSTGELYSEREYAAYGKAFLERCDGDRHQFRFIVSAEDGAEYDDLRPLVRRFMARMEEDFGTRLDWAAVNHFDTGHTRDPLDVPAK